MDAIIYKSNTGFTKKYAEMLAEELSLPCYSLDEKPDAKDIIYMGWIFGNSIQGYKKAANKYNIKCVCAVGMTYPSEKQARQVSENNDINDVNGVKLFCLQGGVKKSALNGFMRLILNFAQKSMEKSGEKDEESLKVLDALTNGGDFVKKENLTEVIEFIRK